MTLHALGNLFVGKGFFCAGRDKRTTEFYLNSTRFHEPRRANGTGGMFPPDFLQLLRSYTLFRFEKKISFSLGNVAPFQLAGSILHGKNAYLVGMVAGEAAGVSECQPSNVLLLRLGCQGKEILAAGADDDVLQAARQLLCYLERDFLGLLLLFFCILATHGHVLLVNPGNWKATPLSCYRASGG